MGTKDPGTTTTPGVRFPLGLPVTVFTPTSPRVAWRDSAGRGNFPRPRTFLRSVAPKKRGLGLIEHPVNCSYRSLIAWRGSDHPARTTGAEAGGTRIGGAACLAPVPTAKAHRHPQEVGVPFPGALGGDPYPHVSEGGHGGCAGRGFCIATRRSSRGPAPSSLFVRRSAPEETSAGSGSSRPTPCRPPPSDDARSDTFTPTGDGIGPARLEE